MCFSVRHHVNKLCQFKLTVSLVGCFAKVFFTERSYFRFMQSQLLIYSVIPVSLLGNRQFSNFSLVLLNRLPEKGQCYNPYFFRFIIVIISVLFILTCFSTIGSTLGFFDISFDRQTLYCHTIQLELITKQDLQTSATSGGFLSLRAIYSRQPLDRWIGRLFIMFTKPKVH